MLPCVRGANKPEFGNKPIKDVRQDYMATGCRGGQYLRSLRLELKDWENIRAPFAFCEPAHDSNEQPTLSVLN